MTGLLRHARHEAVALARNEAHMFAARHALVHYASGAVYSFIPKNGCSTLRLSLALANNCIAGPDDWTWIHPNNETFAASLADLVRASYSFVVVRCPHARLASVFLDKIVDKTPELWQLYRLTRDGFDPDAVTFRAFVDLLDDSALRGANIHWRPQTDFLVYERYTNVFALERFDDAVRTLHERIGLAVRDARQLTRHGTDAVELVRHGSYADVPIADIAAMKREGRLPAHPTLYDKALRDRVSRLYAGDLAFYTDRCGRDGLTFPTTTMD